MGKHQVIPCSLSAPSADQDELLVDNATAREHIDTLRDVTTEIARTVAGLDGQATPHDVRRKLAAVLAGAAPPSPDLKRDRAKRDDLERALRSVDDLRRAVRRGTGVDIDALLDTMPPGISAPPPAPPSPRNAAPGAPSTPPPPPARRFSLRRMIGEAYRRGAGVR